MSQITFGYVTLEGRRFDLPTSDQVLPGLRLGAETERSSQNGLYKLKLNDFSAGLLPAGASGVRPVQTDLNRILKNEGLQTRLPGLCCLPYLVTNQTALTNDIDTSGLIAINRRRHVLASAVGSSTIRYYEGISTMFLRNVGSGDSALEVASCNVAAAGASTVLPGRVTAIGHVVVNQTIALALALDGGADIIYTTNPTASPVVFSQLVALASGDFIWGLGYSPTLGPAGANFFGGRVGGTDGKWWFDTTTAAPWTLKRVVDSATRTQANTTPTTTTSALSLGLSAQDSSSSCGTPNLFCNDLDAAPSSMDYTTDGGSAIAAGLVM